MTTKRIIATLMGCTFVLVLCGTALAGPEANGDRTLSPYFHVKSDDPELDPLPLKSTSVEVGISGVVADVRVTQTYKNEGKRPIEAIYIFPASTRAAVYAMKMVIGERTIVAEIRKREDARREYEAAKNAGKSASLLEQQRPNVFQMNVANILPGDLVRVELQYTELLVPLDSVYEFVYPTVVGPRYAGQPERSPPQAKTGSQTPTCMRGRRQRKPSGFRSPSQPACPSKTSPARPTRLAIAYDGEMDSMVRLDPAETNGSNRDFILRYRLAGKPRANGPSPLRGQGRKLLPVHGPAAEAGSCGADSAQGVHLRGGRLRVHERIPARSFKIFAQGPDRIPSAD